MTAAITNIDFAILNFIQNNMRSELSDALMKFFTLLGNGGLIWIILGLALCCAKKYRLCGAAVIAGLLLGLVLSTWGLKNIVCRPRPFLQNPNAALIIPPPSGYSFPSGHALSSFTAAFLLLMYRVKYIDIAALVSACLIAFSRIYLYVHFPTDILGGIAAAAIISAAVYCVTKNLPFRKIRRGGYFVWDPKTVEPRLRRRK